MVKMSRGEVVIVRPYEALQPTKVTVNLRGEGFLDGHLPALLVSIAKIIGSNFKLIDPAEDNDHE